MLTDFAIKNISARADFDDLNSIVQAYEAHIADREAVNTDQAIVRFDLHSIEHSPIIEGGNAYFESKIRGIEYWREGIGGQHLEGVHVEIAYSDFGKYFGSPNHWYPPRKVVSIPARIRSLGARLPVTLFLNNTWEEEDD